MSISMNVGKAMTTPPPKTVAIIGAAVAGPTLALHLLTHPVLRTHFRPILFDQSPPPAPIPTSSSSRTGAESTPGSASSPSTTSRQQRAGASVGLFSNGLHPLFNLGLSDAIKKYGHECDDLALWSSSSSVDDPKLTHIKSAKNGFWSHEFQLGAMYFERAGLQALLVDRVHDLGGEVKWNKKAVNFEAVSAHDSEIKRTRVDFADGTHIEVDLLVGADGGYSPIRRHILNLRNPKAAEERWLPDFMGTTGIYGISSADKMPSTHTPQRPFNESHCVFLPEGFLATGPCPEKMFRWDLILPETTPPNPSTASDDPDSPAKEAPSTPETEDENTEEPWQAAIVPGQYSKSTTASILRSHLRLKHPFTGDFETMLNTSDRIIHTPLRQRVWKEDEIQWTGDGNIVLIGDAARLMLPTSGQGTGFAIEDATVLASMLLKHNTSSSTSEKATSKLDNDFKAALEEYAKLRRPRSEKMATMAAWIGSVGLGATWYNRLLRYSSARLSPGTDLKTKQNKDPWPMDGRFNLE
ncbi:salicylate hydroxylase [Colletotrichum karsti]|uniref:Salicylate hydroxylase n=1 Tax=Colletotrichum karsti TaxID=1095194 RepID=A0A9P6I9D7_9PEZI|nr:salicylate hydroxylase [Colletotrichum karsti]KAF9876366.1 salicylate hydroxylase [Colletotrichum karsti]